MPIEIRTPELEQRVRTQMQSGQFHDVDELLTKALDALEGRGQASTTPVPCGGNDETDSGAALLTVLQNSPYPEIDLAPLRERVSAPVRDVVL